MSLKSNIFFVILASDFLKEIQYKIMETLQEVKARVYKFGNKTADGNTTMKNLLGGKGANLAEMSAIGIPVLRDLQ